MQADIWEVQRLEEVALQLFFLCQLLQGIENKSWLNQRHAHNLVSWNFLHLSPLFSHSCKISRVFAAWFMLQSRF